MATLELVIGDKNLSSWSLRPWLVLRHAGIPFEERLVPFATDAWREHIGALSPSRRVPALRHGELLLWESLAICEHLAESFPDAALWPPDTAARAVARAVSAEMHAGFSHLRRDLPLDVVGRVPRRQLASETEADVARVQAIWTDCRARFGERGPFLFGRFSIADAMFAPVAFRFRTYDVPVTEPRARAWMEAMLALPAMREWERGAEEEVRGGARTSHPPHPASATEHYAVVFTSQLRGDPEGYEETARRMDELARAQPGFLGLESARGPDGFGVTVSYWASLEAIRRWRDHPEHAAARARGRDRYYERYELRVCNVERGYRFP